MLNEIPKIQTALQLTGPDQLVLNTSKAVHAPGPHQILCQVEAVGLCFSDLKLLKQFSSHPRKTEVISGIEGAILKEIPSYVPGQAPAVPGHEAVVRVCAVGESVTKFKQGHRYLVQTDYRWLLTANSNAAFGYNFEGALQEYVLMDQRVITSPQGESMLIAVSEKLSASAVALVEPWACVEDAYAAKERQSLKVGGRMAVVADVPVPAKLFRKFFESFGEPGKISWVSQSAPPEELGIPVEPLKDIKQLPNGGFNDVVYFGSNPKTIENLFAKVAANGLFNVTLCGGSLVAETACAIGRVHYGGIRIIGTTESDPAKAMESIPKSGEIRKGDKINIVGAAGPMGMMHVIRNICQGAGEVKIFAGDIDDRRLALLNQAAETLAAKNKVSYSSYNPAKNNRQEKFDYTILMAPVPELVAEAVTKSRQGGIINIFAGIAANVTAAIDMDSYIRKGMYFIGTSGSTLEDMKRVLKKAEGSALDTNLSVAAVCGLDGAAEGIKAIEDHSIAGKIIVYPKCKGLKLTTLPQLKETFPQVLQHLANGFWNAEAEKALLAMY